MWVAFWDIRTPVTLRILFSSPTLFRWWICTCNLASYARSSEFIYFWVMRRLVYFRSLYWLLSKVTQHAKNSSDTAFWDIRSRCPRAMLRQGTTAFCNCVDQFFWNRQQKGEGIPISAPLFAFFQDMLDGEMSLFGTRILRCWSVFPFPYQVWHKLRVGFNHQVMKALRISSWAKSSARHW